MPEVTTEEGDGDCFVVALHNALENEHYRLVHGLVRHAETGLYHWHAWNEHTEHHTIDIDGTPVSIDIEVVVDKSNGHDIVMPKDALHNMVLVTNVRSYSQEEVFKMMIEHEHYGPWHEEDLSEVEDE